MTDESAVLQLELMQARVAFIPRGWRFSKVGEAFQIRNNLRRPISQEERAKDPGPYPYYGPTRIQDYIGSYFQDGAYALIGEDGDHFLKYRVQKMTQLVDGKCTVNNHAHVIEGTAISTREWFYHYFMHRDIFSFLTRQGAGRFKLNKEALEKIPLLVPPIEEQDKIAQILSTWDEAIATTEQLLASSEQQKKALMQHLLTGKKRLPGFDGKWKECRLSDLVTVFDKKTDSNNRYPVVTSSRKGLLLQTEYFKKKVASNDTTGYRVVPKGYVTFRAMSDDGVFVFNRQTILENAVVSPAYGVFCFKNMDPVFGIELLNSPAMAREVRKLSQGGTRTSLRTSSFREIRLKVPGGKEQERIAAIILAAIREVECLSDGLVSLKREKKALMQQLLTGKRRVKVDEAEQATA